MEGYHVAQANVAHGLASLDDPVMAGFVEQLEYINSVADGAEGFVWRLQTEAGDSTGIRVFNDPLIVLNMSVWESMEHLYNYVFRSDHLGPVKHRGEWFQKMDRPHSVLWWIAEGYRPTVADAEHRLDLLHALGPSPGAFTFANSFDPQGQPVARGAGIDRECGV